MRDGYLRRDYPTLRASVRSCASRWPGPAGALWWLLRPAATLAALAAAALHLATGHAVLPAVLAIGLTLLVRPVSRPWYAIPAAAAAAVMVPWAGAALAVRALAGAAAVRLAGTSWQAGLEAVRAGRRDLLQPVFGRLGTVEEEWAELAAAVGGGERRADLAVDAWVVVAAAWCAADARLLPATAAEVLRSQRSGHWRFPVPPGVGAHEFRLGARIHLIGAVAHGTAVVGAAVAVRLSGLAEPAHPFGLQIPGWAAVGVAVLTAWQIVHPQQFVLMRLGPVLSLALAFLLYGTHAAVLVLVGVAAAVPARTLRSALEQRVVGQRSRVPRLRLGRGWVTAHDHWAAARKALLDGRPAIAAKLWGQLAADPQRPPSVRAAASAALAGLALDDGDLQLAVDRATAALEQLPPRARVAPQVHAAAGLALLAAGETRQAEEQLDTASKDRRYRNDPLLTARRAQARALPGAAGPQAVEQHGGTAQGRADSLVQIVEDQVSAALTHHHVPLEERAAGLEDMLQTMDFDATEIQDAGVLARIRWAQARGWLALGRLQQELERYEDAADSLRSAVAGLSGPAHAMERAVARTLLGAALSRANPAHAMTPLASGVRDLEQHRGRLTAGLHRGGLIDRYGDVYTLAFDSAVRLQDQGPAAGLLGAELAESLRRDGLAHALRDGQWDVTPRLRELRDRLAAIEEGGPDTADAEIDACREALEAELSEVFAASYLPSPVDLGALRAAVGAAHVLTYRVDSDTPTRLRGHAVWTPPGGTPVVARFDIRDPDVLALLGSGGAAAGPAEAAARLRERNAVMQARQTPQERDRWQRAGAALIPPLLRRQLMKHEAEYPASVLIVPDGTLAALPWAGLRLDDGRLLVTVAVLQTVPTLGLLTGRPSPTDGRRTAGLSGVLAHFGPATRAEERERLLGAGPDVTSVDTRDRFLAELSASPPQGCYLAVHGFAEGLGQHVRFADGSRLSAATALTAPWPPWVVFASCLVGRLSLRPGQEPLGMPVSCLLGGADSVIGGVIDVYSPTAGELASRIAVRLLNGEHPAHALRAEQLAILDGRTTPARPFVWGAGFICLSRLSPVAV